ncbi:HEAT repeat domain-containing protein [Dictyobacter kobayashii]|nr:HEAT repeat domain-containing protein [Dictyobacter kobayashii]
MITENALAAQGENIPLTYILSWLEDANPLNGSVLRYYAITLAGYMGENAPVKLLLTLFDHPVDLKRDRREAAQALAKLGAYAPLDEMLARLHNADGDICPAMFHALSNMPLYAPVNIFVQALEDDDSEIKSIADDALSELVRKAPARLIEFARDDTRPIVRNQVLEALEKLGENASLDIALASLEDPATRFEAMHTLSELKVDISTLIPLETFLHYTSEDRIFNDVELTLLAQYGSQISLDLLLKNIGNTTAAKILYQTYPEVFRDRIAPHAEAILRGAPVSGIFTMFMRQRVAATIGQIGRATPEVLNLLIDLLDDPYWETRMEAARSLGAIHRNIPDRAIRRLLELRHDPQSNQVSQAADAALAQILSYENGMEDE